jgi:hypothetical protein
MNNKIGIVGNQTMFFLLQMKDHTFLPLPNPTNNPTIEHNIQQFMNLHNINK